MATNEYLCPDWMKRLRVSESDYRQWLDAQATAIWQRENLKGKSGFAARSALKQALHKAAHVSNGCDPYTNTPIFVGHICDEWADPLAHRNGDRHHLTVRRTMASFDHIKGLGRGGYELCTRESNAAKSFMSPKQFIDLCHRVAKAHPRAK